MCAAQGEADGVLNELADGSALLDGCTTASKGEELLRQIARAHGGVLRIHQTRGHFAIIFCR